jgi:phage tail-like protein
MPSSDEWLGGDPPIASRFLFEVDGVEIGIFKEVKGLEANVGVEEIKEGGQNSFVRKVPGRMTWPEITFRRGLTESDALFEWFSKSSGTGFAGNQNSLKRTKATITAITHTGARLRSWHLVDAFPIKWRGPESFSVDNKVPLEEELTIAHHGFTSESFQVP